MSAQRQTLRVVRRDGADAAAGTGLDALFRRYSAYVAAIGLKLLGNPEQVDDLVQDVFLAAQQKIESLQDPAAVRGWLATVTVRMARRRLRRRRLLTWVGLYEAPDISAALAVHSNQEERVLLTRVFDALDRLPVEQRLAWTLRYLEGERLQRVAELCGCSLATAKRRITQAQRLLQEVVGHE